MALTYDDSGVSLDRARNWVDVVKNAASRISDPSVRGGIGGFAGLYSLGNGSLLAACTDGVGTKLEIARKAKIFRGLGQDLVAMNVNDLVTCGARPLFFLDYIACGVLDTEPLGEVMEGVVDACIASGCALLGGETAEMPGVYEPGSFDLAGFSVGLVDEAALVTGDDIQPGDVMIGVSSSGLHSNGFSLVRASLLENGSDLPLWEPDSETGRPLVETLLEPTKLYVKLALAAHGKGLVRGMAHITGGGLEENISRVIPAGLSPEIDFGCWKRPAVFELISGAGVPEEEMRSVFNLGIGFVFIASPENADPIRALCSEHGDEATVIGRIAR